MYYGIYRLTYASKPRICLPWYITQDGREGATVGFRDVALCLYRRVSFIWTEEGFKRGVDVVSYSGYAAYEAWSVMPLDLIVNVTNLCMSTHKQEKNQESSYFKLVMHDEHMNDVFINKW